MKRKLFILIVLTLCLMPVLAACNTTDSNSGGNPKQSSQNNSGDSKSNDASGKRAASITPADGWEKRDSISGSRITYAYADIDKAYNTLINVDTEENLLGKTNREFAEKRIESQKITLESWKPVFTDIADVTVGEYNALAYDVVTEAGELQKMFFIFEGSYVYIIQCATMTEFWELVQDDFTAMIDSFTLK